MKSGAASSIYYSCPIVTIYEIICSIKKTSCSISITRIITYKGVKIENIICFNSSAILYISLQSQGACVCLGLYFFQHSVAEHKLLCPLHSPRVSQFEVNVSEDTEDLLNGCRRGY